MAKRSRKSRQEIPGYDEKKPSREERKLQHRQVRHNTHQLLHMVDDPDEVSGLPEVRRTRTHEAPVANPDPQKSRFKLWKTKFWKRRGEYRDVKASMDADWPVVTPEQLEDR